MSRGIDTIEFVRQVYYAQEKVYLDFVPTDDKFKEVLLEANFVLQELQKEEDWNWLRTQTILGLTQRDMRYFIAPEDFYKASTVFNDCLRLYAYKSACSESGCPNFNKALGDDGFSWGACKYHCFDRAPFIAVPFVPIGWQNDFAERQMSFVTRPNVQDMTIGVSVVNDGSVIDSETGRTGDKLVFSRPLIMPEIDKVAVLQYQRLIPKFHICNSSCHGVDASKPISYDPDPENWNPCSELYMTSAQPKLMLTEVPDPMYVIIRTAQYHAEGSPPAQGRIAGLQDQAQKMLSAMRENNAAATTSDYIPSWNPGFWMVV